MCLMNIQAVGGGDVLGGEAEDLSDFLARIELGVLR